MIVLATVAAAVTALDGVDSAVHAVAAGAIARAAAAAAAADGAVGAAADAPRRLHGHHSSPLLRQLHASLKQKPILCLNIILVYLHKKEYIFILKYIFIENKSKFFFVI